MKPTITLPKAKPPPKTPKKSDNDKPSISHPKTPFIDHKHRTAINPVNLQVPPDLSQKHLKQSASKLVALWDDYRTDVMDSQRYSTDLKSWMSLTGHLDPQFCRDYVPCLTDPVLLPLLYDHVRDIRALIVWSTKCLRRHFYGVDPLDKESLIFYLIHNATVTTELVPPPAVTVEPKFDVNGNPISLCAIKVNTPSTPKKDKVSLETAKQRRAEIKQQKRRAKRELKCGMSEEQRTERRKARIERRAARALANGTSVPCGAIPEADEEDERMDRFNEPPVSSSKYPTEPQSPQPTPSSSSIFSSFTTSTPLTIVTPPTSFFFNSPPQDCDEDDESDESHFRNPEEQVHLLDDNLKELCEPEFSVTTDGQPIMSTAPMFNRNNPYYKSPELNRGSSYGTQIKVSNSGTVQQCMPSLIVPKNNSNGNNSITTDKSQTNSHVSMQTSELTLHSHSSTHYQSNIASVRQYVSQSSASASLVPPNGALSPFPPKLANNNSTSTSNSLDYGEFSFEFTLGQNQPLVLGGVSSGAPDATGDLPQNDSTSLQEANKILHNDETDFTQYYPPVPDYYPLLPPTESFSDLISPITKHKLEITLFSKQNPIWTENVQIDLVASMLPIFSGLMHHIHTMKEAHRPPPQFEIFDKTTKKGTIRLKEKQKKQKKKDKEDFPLPTLEDQQQALNTIMIDTIAVILEFFANISFYQPLLPSSYEKLKQSNIMVLSVWSVSRCISQSISTQAMSFITNALMHDPVMAHGVFLELSLRCNMIGLGQRRFEQLVDINMLPVKHKLKEQDRIMEKRRTLQEQQQFAQQQQRERKVRIGDPGGERANHISPKQKAMMAREELAKAERALRTKQSSEPLLFHQLEPLQKLLNYYQVLLHNLLSLYRFNYVTKQYVNNAHCHILYVVRYVQFLATAVATQSVPLLAFQMLRTPGTNIESRHHKLAMYYNMHSYYQRLFVYNAQSMSSTVESEYRSLPRHAFFPVKPKGISIFTRMYSRLKNFFSPPSAAEVERVRLREQIQYHNEQITLMKTFAKNRYYIPAYVQPITYNPVALFLNKQINYLHTVPERNRLHAMEMERAIEEKRLEEEAEKRERDDRAAHRNARIALREERRLLCVAALQKWAIMRREHQLLTEQRERERLEQLEAERIKKQAVIDLMVEQSQTLYGKQVEEREQKLKFEREKKAKLERRRNRGGLFNDSDDEFRDHNDGIFQVVTTDTLFHDDVGFEGYNNMYTTPANPMIHASSPNHQLQQNGGFTFTASDEPQNQVSGIINNTITNQLSNPHSSQPITATITAPNSTPQKHSPILPREPSMTPDAIRPHPTLDLSGPDELLVLHASATHFTHHDTNKSGNPLHGSLLQLDHQQQQPQTIGTRSTRPSLSLRKTKHRVDHSFDDEFDDDDCEDHNIDNPRKSKEVQKPALKAVEEKEKIPQTVFNNTTNGNIMETVKEESKEIPTPSIIDPNEIYISFQPTLEHTQDEIIDIFNFTDFLDLEFDDEDDKVLKEVDMDMSVWQLRVISEETFRQTNIITTVMEKLHKHDAIRQESRNQGCFRFDFSKKTKRQQRAQQFEKLELALQFERMALVRPLLKQCVRLMEQISEFINNPNLNNNCVDQVGVIWDPNGNDNQVSDVFLHYLEGMQITMIKLATTYRLDYPKTSFSHIDADEPYMFNHVNMFPHPRRME